jgi:type II secretory pathway component HofQ
MSTQATVIGSYDAVRRSRDAQDQRSRSADGEGDNLMKGRTFIPRMSAESRKLLIEAMQRAKKKRQERMAKKKADQIVGTGYSSVEEMKEAERAKFKEGRAEMRQDRIDIRNEDRQSRLERKVSARIDKDISELTEDDFLKDEDIQDPKSGTNANGGKIPRYKKRTIKYRR